MRVAVITPLVAALLLSGCVVPTGPVEVTRFNRVAEGETYGQGSYVIELSDADDDGNPGLAERDADGLALSPYIAAVQREMNRIGYGVRPAGGADYTASIRVRIDNHVRQGRSPVSVGVGGGSGGYRSGVGVGVGLNLGGGPKKRVVTSLSVRIRRNSDNQIIWEGTATQDAGKGTPAAQPGIAASKLAEGLFAGFPGENGETITIP
ncbi:MAG: DUF4136 domain-containing protein [Sphingorhabdus sp.]